MRKFAVLGLTLGLLLSWALTDRAFAVTIYTDKTVWENAVGWQFETEDFTDDTLNDGVSYTASESGIINITNGYYQDVLKSSSANEPQTTWNFNPSITGYIQAYGGNWDLGGPGGGGNNLLVYVNDPDNPESYTQVGTISYTFKGGFWGFISPTPFTSVRLIGGTGDHQQNYYLDNMVYSPVPVPGTLGLLSGGLLGLLAIRRFML